MQLKDLERKYGVDFGNDSEMEVADYLRMKGFKSLAETLKVSENKGGENE